MQHKPGGVLGLLHTLRDNLRWVASQLQLYGRLKHPKITISWCGYSILKVVKGNVPNICSLNYLLTPFEALRNVKRLVIAHSLPEILLPTGQSYTMRGPFAKWQEVVNFTRCMRTILGSSALVMRSSIPLQQWLGFKKL